jgi:hypothetical protein
MRSNSPDASVDPPSSSPHARAVAELNAPRPAITDLDRARARRALKRIAGAAS